MVQQDPEQNASYSRSEFPESLVSDSKPRVSRLRTRVSLGLGLESMALTRLGLGLVNTFLAVFSSKLGQK